MKEILIILTVIFIITGIIFAGVGLNTMYHYDSNSYNSSSRIVGGDAYNYIIIANRGIGLINTGIIAVIIGLIFALYSIKYKNIDNNKSMDEDNMNIYNKVADYCHENNEYEKAIEYYEKANNEDGVKKSYNILASKYLVEGKYDNAVNAYIKSGMSETDAYNMVADYCHENNEYEKAIEYYEKANNEKGDYDNAMRCYEEQKQICMELGDRMGYSIAVGNMGELYRDTDRYDEAMKCYNEAIETANEIGFKVATCHFSYGKAKVLFDTDKPSEAKKLNDEALQIAKEVESPDDIFDASILRLKIDAALGDKDTAVAEMRGLVEEFTDDGQVAAIHYEIWKLTDDASHRDKAMEMYRALYETTPKYEYKKRMDEMSAGD